VLDLTTGRVLHWLTGWLGGMAFAPDGKALYAKATDIYLTALSSIPLHHPNWFFAARKSVGGIVMVPDGLLRLVGVRPVN